MESFLLLFAVILLAGVWTARLGNRLGFPVLIGFVAVGVVVGPGGFHITPPVPLTWVKYVGYIALILILFEGGLHTSIARIRKAWLPAMSLATLGVLISAFIMAVLSYYLLQLPVYAAAMVGVAVSSTDAAAVFSMLSGRPLRRHLVDILEVESGTNDPMAFFLTLVLIQWSISGHGPFWHAAGYVVEMFALQMCVGLVVGVAVGFAGSFINQRIKLDTGGLYPTLSLAFALLSYSLAVLFHGSGFLSVYIASVVMGNRRLEHRYSIIRFHEGLAWTMQILMFVVLGFQVTLGRLSSIALPGLALAVGALFIARPTAVWLSTLGMKLQWKEKHFLSWAGLRGAVPIVLVVTADLSSARTPPVMIDAVFFVVIASTLIQGLTVKPLARKLDLFEDAPSDGVLELVAIARENAIVLPVEVTESSRFIDRQMVDIPFPQNTLCYALIRGTKVIVPRGATHIQPGDKLLVLSDRRHIQELRDLFEKELVGNPALLP